MAGDCDPTSAPSVQCDTTTLAFTWEVGEGDSSITSPVFEP